jgi:hypothetical protein
VVDTTQERIVLEAQGADNLDSLLREMPRELTAEQVERVLSLREEVAREGAASTGTGGDAEDKSQAQPLIPSAANGPAMGDEQDHPGDVVGGAGCSAGGQRSGQSHWMIIIGMAAIVGRWSFGRRGYPSLRPGMVSKVTGVSLIALLSVAAAPLHAQTTTYLAALVFWDEHGFRYNEPGNRGETICDSNLLNCDPSVANCCREFLPRVDFQAYQYNVVTGTRGAQIAAGPVDDTGFVTFTRPSPVTSGIQFIVTYRNDNPSLPAFFPNMKIVTAAAPTTTARATSQAVAVTNASWQWLGNVQIGSNNTATDSASYGSSAWRQSFRLFSMLRAQDSFDPFFLDFQLYTMVEIAPNATSFANCSTRTLNVAASEFSATTVAHEWGHLVHAKMMGCSGGIPAFPEDYWGSNMNHRWNAMESSLNESIATLFNFYIEFNPANAPHYPTLWWHVANSAGASCVELTTCTEAEWQNAQVNRSTRVCGEIVEPAGINNVWDVYESDHINDIAGERNNTLVLWDFIDTPVDGVDVNAADQLDLTMKQLWDAFAFWQSAGGTGNGDSFESSSTTQTATQCVRHEDCLSTEVCHSIEGRCYSGDVHGNNLRDLARYFSAATGDANAESKARGTIQANLCVGLNDVTYPFRGGFRQD